MLYLIYFFIFSERFRETFQRKSTDTPFKIAIEQVPVIMKQRLVSVGITALFSTIPTACSFGLKTNSARPLSRTMASVTDSEYPGTALERLKNVRARVASLSEEDLSQDWSETRRKLLWAGGLRDLPIAVPGKGYTGHSFNDYNHVDLTTMTDNNSDNLNDGEVKQIAVGNFLGEGIRIASIAELGSGGSWSTCAIGCNVEPPRDVAHIQFRSRIAFKLVWCPTENFDRFVLVGDDGGLLAKGSPKGDLPAMRERVMNYRLVQGSKYAHAADEIAAELQSNRQI